jgi:phospholipid/cholesterol/gamma-HCH transport system substrate-binding protein
MPQHERVQWAQLRVGALIIVSLALFAVAVFFISGQGGFFTRHYTLKAYLPTAGDLREGAQVRLAGISVGSVVKIRISPYAEKERAVELDLKIARTFQKEIRGDSVASVNTVGLLGDSYVDITRGTTAQEPIPDDGTVPTVKSSDIAAVMQNTNQAIVSLNAVATRLEGITAQIQSGKGSVGKLIYDQSLYNKANSTLTGMQAMVDRAQRGEGSLGKLMYDDTLYNRSVATLDRLNNVIDEVQHGEGSLAKFISDPAVYNNLNRLMSNGNTLIDGVNQGHGTLGKLVKDEQFYNRMSSTLDHMDNITARIDKGEGTLGKLSTDPSLFKNLNDSLQSFEEFLTDFRKTPKKYLSIKLHIF